MCGSPRQRRFRARAQRRWCVHLRSRRHANKGSSNMQVTTTSKVSQRRIAAQTDGRTGERRERTSCKTCWCLQKNKKRQHTTHKSMSRRPVNRQADVNNSRWLRNSLQTVGARPERGRYLPAVLAELRAADDADSNADASAAANNAAAAAVATNTPAYNDPVYLKLMKTRDEDKQRRQVVAAAAGSQICQTTLSAKLLCLTDDQQVLLSLRRLAKLRVQQRALSSTIQQQAMSHQQQARRHRQRRC